MDEPGLNGDLLLSNDDGIYAPGLMAMERVLRELGAVAVVAPTDERSAVGHAITIADPIKTRKIRRGENFEGYAVDGTPADCVKLAVNVLMKTPPRLVVSGINLGPNVGISVIYSGTVGAAAEGAILGLPSMAISLGAFTHPRWDTAALVGRYLAGEILARGLPENTLLNVNVPNLPHARLKGIRITRMGRSRFVERFHQRATPRGESYYWLDGDLKMLGDIAGTDIEALEQGFVSVTPITFDLTHHTARPILEGWKLHLDPDAENEFEKQHPHP